MSRVALVTFDVYSALFDIAGSLTGRLRECTRQALGSTAAGIRCYWSNRTGDVPLDPAYAPAFTGTSLEGLLELLP